MNLFKRGTVFNVFFRLGGRQVNRSTGETDLDLARIQAARIYLAAVDRAAECDVKTIDEVIELYWRWHRTRGPEAPGRRPTFVTAHAYENKLRQLCSVLKIKTPSELAQVAPDITAAKLNMSESSYISTVRQAAGMFNLRFLAWAKTIGRKISNPLVGYIPPPPLQRQFLAPADAYIRRLNAAAEAELQRNELLAFKLCLGAGLRIGEATHLKWKNVTSRSIVVESTSEKRTKNCESREIPVSQTLIAVLEKHRGLPEDYVIADAGPSKPSKYGRPHRRSDRVSKRLIRWLRKQGVTAKQPIHFLRKIFASTVTRRHDIYTASKWLGHSSVVVTERVYAAVAEDKFADVV